MATSGEQDKYMVGTLADNLYDVRGFTMRLQESFAMTRTLSKDISM